MKSNLLTISLADSERARTAGMAYLSKKYRDRLGVYPSQPRHLLIGAVESTVVATMGINATKSQLLAIAVRHGVSNRFGQDAIELCRWCADSPEYASQIALAAIRCCIDMGARVALVEQRPAVFRRSRQLGVTLTPVEGAVLDYSKIDYHHLSFYTQCPPGLYSLDLRLAEAELVAHIENK